MSNICIYCMGDYGLETYFKLKEMGIKINCFGDRDLSKHGYALDGISCISYEDVLKLDKKKSIIVVAVKNSKTLIEQFKKHGFESVYDKDEIISIVEKDLEEKRDITLMQIERIKGYKENLVKAYYENVYKDRLDNEDMQQIIDDLLQRRKGNSA